MDRMQPPPNYYGAPYSGFGPVNPGMGQPQMNPQVSPVMATPATPTPPTPGTQTQPNETPMQNNDYYDDSNTYTGNRGKRVRVYCSFTDSSKWHDVVFEGTIVFGTIDRLCVKADDKELYYVIVGVYINYIEYLDKPFVPPIQ